MNFLSGEALMGRIGGGPGAFEGHTLTCRHPCDVGGASRLMGFRAAALHGRRWGRVAMSNVSSSCHFYYNYVFAVLLRFAVCAYRRCFAVASSSSFFPIHSLAPPHKWRFLTSGSPLPWHMRGGLPAWREGVARLLPNLCCEPERLRSSPFLRGTSLSPAFV